MRERETERVQERNREVESGMGDRLTETEKETERMT